MFDWLGDIISGMGDAIGNAFTGISDSIIDAILNRFIQWLFKSIYDGIANFFTQISNMGTEIFDLSWVQAVVKLFSLFGIWTEQHGDPRAVYSLYDKRTGVMTCYKNLDVSSVGMDYLGHPVSADIPGCLVTYSVDDTDGDAVSLCVYRMK